MAVRHRQLIFKASEEELLKLKKGPELTRLNFSAWARSVLLNEVDRLERERVVRDDAQPV